MKKLEIKNRELTKKITFFLVIISFTIYSM